MLHSGVAMVLLALACRLPTLDIRNVAAVHERVFGLFPNDDGSLDYATADQICRDQGWPQCHPFVDIDPGESRLLDVRGDVDLADSGVLVTLNQHDGTITPYPLAIDPLQARLTDAGFVALFADSGGRCGVTHQDGTAWVFPFRCAPDTAFVVDATEVAWIASPDGLRSVTPDGVAVSYDATPDILTLDPSGIVVFGVRGGTKISGMGADGRVLWSFFTEGPIHAAAANNVLMLSVGTDDSAELDAVDQLLGAQVLGREVPSLMDDLAFSPSGRFLGFAARDVDLNEDVGIVFEVGGMVDGHLRHTVHSQLDNSALREDRTTVGEPVDVAP
jgi:hypothetical protein